MPSSTRWLFSLTVAAALQTRAAMPPDLDVPIAWTKDSSAFVTQVNDVWTIIDARTGARSTIKGLEPFTRWAAAHPLTRSPDDGFTSESESDRATSADGSTTIECPGASFKTVWFSDKPFSCSAKRDGVSVALKPRNARGRLAQFWAPNGRRVVMFLRDERCTPSMGDFACEYVNEFVVDRTVGPRLHLAVYGQADDAVKKAVEALERAGFAPTQLTPAQKERRATVVYAAKGAEAEAKRVASVLAGATIEPLTWKTDAELVVALGK